MRIAATVALILLTVAPAAAADRDFTLHNHTARIMKSLFVSPSGANKWSDDILGQDILDQRTDLEVKFDRDDTECKYDVRAVFADGSTEQLHDVDLCASGDVTFTPEGASTP
jgi:hypothetical protein